MKAYFSFFKIRFINSLQYRAAAYAGIATQFAWGFMTISMFHAFYINDANSFPMTFEQCTAYIWLQQALMTLFAAWYFENDIFDDIASGNVAYELCRPTRIYEMWFIRSIASRVSKVVLRCLPILLVAFLLPKPFGISPPVNISSFILFFISLIFGLIIVTGINMLVYISAFYTLSPMGIRIISVSLAELLSGAVIPVPFLMDPIRTIFNLMPFASTQNTPFLLYNGYLVGLDAYYSILLQFTWLIIVIIFGKYLMKKALKKVVVQGG